MYKIYILLLLSVLPAVSQAQSTQYNTLFSARQESIPPNDSGGRWLPSALLLTSFSAYPQHIQILTSNTFNEYTNGIWTADTIYKIADSSYFIADSIFVIGNPWIRSSTPSKYIDSIYPSAYTQLDFLLPARGTLRVPIKIQEVKRSGVPGDTMSHVMQILSYSDSAGKGQEYAINFNVRCITMYGGDYAYWQESIPSTDSGGKWMPMAVIFKSISAFPVKVTFVTHDFKATTTDTLWKIADSAWDMADSIDVTRGFEHFLSGNPSLWRDSSYSFADIFYIIPPHGSLRIPFMIRAISGYGPLSGHFDTAAYPLLPNFSASYDSSGVIKPANSTDEGYFSLEAVESCVGPFTAFTGTPLNNRNQPVEIGGAPIEFYHTSGYWVNVDRTTVSYTLTGEYTDRFILPDSVISNPDDGGYITFEGAPKSPIHDTLTAIYTDCWGSVTTHTPIEAYSNYPDGYQIHELPLDLKAPFLGRADGNAATVYNTSDFPITLRNLQVFSYYDSLDFEVSGPAMISAHDSGYLSVTLKDRNLYLDTSGTSRSATITGIIAPYQQQLDFKDSTFSVSVSGSIDVYSPLYFSLIPLLKHGLHPAGIIFTSSVSSLSGPGTFLTIYGNNDSTTEYFGIPYYDDPHFTLTNRDYSGFGTETLPGYINPDTGFFASVIQVLTTFTGDSYHNYFTQMHWPRATDTITIDVVALGENAPHLDGVTTYASEPKSVSLWPNPASSILHIRSGDPTANFWIMDILGRKIRTGKGTESSIDISDLPTGLYILSFPKLGESIKFQILR